MAGGCAGLFREGHQTGLQEHQGCGPRPGPPEAADRGGESSKACVDQCQHPEGSQHGQTEVNAPTVPGLGPGEVS